MGLIAQKVVLCAFLMMNASCLLGVNLIIPSIITEILSKAHPDWDKTKLDGEGSTMKSFLDGFNALVALFTLPTIGALSDAYGRKKMMVVVQMAQLMFLGSVFAAFHYKSLWVMYLSSVFYFNSGVLLLSIAYMSDISRDDKDKSKNFGLVLACFLVGSIVGSLALGYLGKFGLLIPLLAVIGLSSVNYLYVILVLRESPQFYANHKGEKFTMRRGNPFSSLSYLLTVSPYVTALVIVYVLIFVGLSDSLTTGVLYTTQRYNWNTFQIGINSAITGVGSILWQTGGVVLLLKFCAKEWILTISMFYSVLIHFCQGSAWEGWMYIASGGAGSFNVVAIPILQTLISIRIPREKQGIAFGGISSLSSIATFVGALATENIFAFCLDGRGFFSCPGTAFYFCAAIYLINGIICIALFRIYPPSRTLPPPSSISPATLPETHEKSPLLSINSYE